MKTYTGELVNMLDDEQKTVITSYLDGTHTGGFYTMRFVNLRKDVEGKDLVYDVALKELAKYREELKAGKVITIHLEWDIQDDYTEYLACRILRVEVKEKEE